MEQPFEIVGKLVGPLLAQIAEPRAIVSKLCDFQRLIHDSIADAVHLQLEKQKLGADGGELVLCVAEQLGALRIGGVGDVIQIGKRADAPHAVGQSFIGGNGFRQPRGIFARQPFQLAGMGIAELRRFLGRSANVRVKPVRLGI